MGEIDGCPWWMKQIHQVNARNRHLFFYQGNSKGHVYGPGNEFGPCVEASKHLSSCKVLTPKGQCGGRVGDTRAFGSESLGGRLKRETFAWWIVWDMKTSSKTTHSLACIGDLLATMYASPQRNRSKGSPISSQTRVSFLTLFGLLNFREAPLGKPTKCKCSMRHLSLRPWHSCGGHPLSSRALRASQPGRLYLDI